MAATEVEEPSEPLKYKTWVLKVSIHCEGCKRKVKKILHTVHGVYAIEIDTKQQKVVVTGNVEAEALLKKLIKAGKHAELWPDLKADQKEKNAVEKKPETGSAGNQAAHAKDIKQPPIEAETAAMQESAKSSQGSGGVPANNSEGGCGPGGAKLPDGAAKSTGGEKVVVDSKVEEKKPETGSVGNPAPPPPVVEKKGGESDIIPGSAQKSGGGSGSGGDGKKKKKKGQNGNNVVSETGASSAAPAKASAGLPNHNGGPPPATTPANHSPPRHQGYQYQPHYYAPPPPVYAVNYNTAHPSSSYAASYYAAPPPYSNAYSYSGSEIESQPSDFESYQHQPLDSFEMFSDENPNGCAVM